MTDLKRSTDGGEPSGSAATTELSPANVPAAHPAPAQTAPTKPSVAGTKPQAPAPTKPVQINGARTTAAIEHSPAKGQPTSAGKPAHKSPAPAVGPRALPRVTDCTQPRCPGTIVDDYCDVCGSPASAPVFVAAEAAASPASPAPAVGPTAGPRVTDCTQPRCPGTIIDDYCDVCGSPASAPAPLPGGAAAAGPTKPTRTDAAQTAVPTKPTRTDAAQTAVPTKPTRTDVAQTAVPTKPTRTDAAQTAVPTKPTRTNAAQTAVPTKSNAARPQLAVPREPSLSSAQTAVPRAPSPGVADPPFTPAKRSRVLPVVLASVSLTLAAVLAVAGISIYRLDRSLTQNIERMDLMPADSSTAPHPTKGQGTAAAEALNLVLMGYDSRDASFARSGSLMILHLNAKRDQAYLISFPRDTWVSIPGHGKNKINAAYGFGGPKGTVSTLENLTDTRMDHAALVDIQGFARLTDEVGGVTVYNKTAFSSHGFNYPKGNITVSGERALYFVGERKALPGGDFDRAANERNLVRAIIAKTLSPRIITDPGRLVSVVSGAAEHLTVDNGLTNSKINSTVLSLRLTDRDVHMMKAPVSGKATKKGQRVDTVDMAKLAELRTALREDRVNEYLARYPQG